MLIMPKLLPVMEGTLDSNFLHKHMQFNCSCRHYFHQKRESHKALIYSLHSYIHVCVCACMSICVCVCVLTSSAMIEPKYWKLST